MKAKKVSSMTVYIVIAHYGFTIHDNFYFKRDKTKLIGVYRDKKKAVKAMHEEIEKAWLLLSKFPVEHNDYIEGQEGTYSLWRTDDHHDLLVNDFTITLIKKTIRSN